MTSKVIKDGKVAVLVHADFGGNWSYGINNKKEREKYMFCPEIIKWIEDGKIYSIEKFIKENFNGNDHTMSLVKELGIEWVDIGRKFFIEDYDGNESIKFYEDIDWQTA